MTPNAIRQKAHGKPPSLSFLRIERPTEGLGTNVYSPKQPGLAYFPLLCSDCAVPQIAKNRSPAIADDSHDVLGLPPPVSPSPMNSSKRREKQIGQVPMTPVHDDSTCGSGSRSGSPRTPRATSARRTSRAQMSDTRPQHIAHTAECLQQQLMQRQPAEGKGAHERHSTAHITHTESALAASTPSYASSNRPEQPLWPSSSAHT